MTFEATYLGSNGWFIKFKNNNLIIDPWLKGDLIFPPGEWFFKGTLEEEISIDKKIDIILITQGLPDHCHVPTLEMNLTCNDLKKDLNLTDGDVVDMLQLVMDRFKNSN